MTKLDRAETDTALVDGFFTPGRDALTDFPRPPLNAPIQLKKLGRFSLHRRVRVNGRKSPFNPQPASAFAVRVALTPAGTLCRSRKPAAGLPGRLFPAPVTRSN